MPLSSISSIAERALRPLRELRRAQKLRSLPSIGRFAPADDTRPLAHVAAFQTSNAGDVLLPLNLKDLVHTYEGGRTWRDVHVHNRVTDRVVRRINGSAGLVIGGGGLFLRDTNPNPWSGWQWSCSMEHLRAIEVPIAVFAVGYNRFPGQPDFAPRFTDHVNLLAERCVYMGLRNQGSIDAMRGYLTPANQEKLRFQPCMTTVAARIYPWLISDARREPLIAVNAAFDREELRFGDDVDAALRRFARGIAALAERTPIAVYAHMQADERVCPYLVDAGVPFELVRLYEMTAVEVMRAYMRPSLAVGMRGHAQMVPFGVETPILSVITHEKLRYFLQDIGHTEWGVDMNAPDFADQLVAAAEPILADVPGTQAKIRSAMTPLWETSCANVRDFVEATRA